MKQKCEIKQGTQAVRKKEKYVETQVENIVVHLQKQKEVREPFKENREDKALCVTDATWPSLLPDLLMAFHF